MAEPAPARAIVEIGEIIGLTIEKVEIVDVTKNVTEWSTNGKGVTGVASEDTRTRILHFTNGTRCEIY